MLTSKEKEEVEKGDFAVVQIVTPLIIGPGTMNALIAYPRVYGPLTTLNRSLHYSRIDLYYTQIFVHNVQVYVGTSVLKGLGKFMSIIVASIVIKLMVGGLRDLKI